MKQNHIYLLSAMMTISAAPAESLRKMAPTAVKAPAVAKAQATPAVYYNLQRIPTTILKTASISDAKATRPQKYNSNP